MESILDIKPLHGFGSLKFGATQKDVEAVLGPPQETETIDVEGEIHEVEVWSYYELGHAVYFEKELNNVVTNFETDNAEAGMFGQKVFQLDQEGIIDLMKQNGFEDHEVEEDPSWTKGLSFSMMPTCSLCLTMAVSRWSAGQWPWMKMKTSAGPDSYADVFLISPEIYPRY